MAVQVAFVMVNWNGMRHTLECLRSLRADTYPDKQILVVDNGSTDGSVAAIQSEFPEVIVLKNGANLGATGGNNAGIRYALETLAANYVLLLNNDTVVEADSVTYLMAAAAALPDIGAFTPVIHSFDNPEKVWMSATSLDMSRGLALHDNRRIPRRDEVPFTIPWISACGMLIRAEALRRVGLFDERYFIIWDDVDLSLRIADAGYGFAVVPASRIYHKVSSAFGGLTANYWYYQVRNNLLCASVHCGDAYSQARRHIVKEYMRVCRHHIQGRGLGFNPIPPTYAAFRDHQRRRYGKRGG